MQERLQKVLASAGVASRRRCEELIEAGQVEVNGKVVTELGLKVDPRRDRIRVQGVALQRPRPVYLVLNKPSEIITTQHDPEGRPTVASLLPPGLPRVYPVGRLDWDTQGVLLLTNDGELTQRLLHPRHGVTKIYRAKVKGHPTRDALARLAGGVTLDDGQKTAPATVELLDANPTNSWLRLVVTEGRHHQVKRMLEAIGHPVIKLRRDSFAGVTSQGLKLGAWRALTKSEVNALRGQVGLPPLPPGPGGELWQAEETPSRRQRRGAAAQQAEGQRPEQAEEPFGPWHPRRRAAARQRREEALAERERARGEHAGRRPLQGEPPRAGAAGRPRRQGEAAAPGEGDGGKAERSRGRGVRRIIRAMGRRTGKGHREGEK